MFQPGFFDFEDRLHKIDKNGDPLAQINDVVDWEVFCPSLEEARDKNRQSNVGPKGYDVVLLFKTLILQSLYNLSDDATEFQILDRHSFERFLGLHIGSKVPDATTIWRFREDLIKAGIVKELFAAFDTQLQGKGLIAMRGQIVDASMINVPKQRNSLDENAQIKEGKPLKTGHKTSEEERMLTLVGPKRMGRHFSGTRTTSMQCLTQSWELRLQHRRINKLA